MIHTTYLSLGSNLGNRLSNLQAAITHITSAVEPLVQSSIYETEPWGYSDQPTFLNLVLKAGTELDPHQLLAFLKESEVELGRKETFRYGPRLIDLDILFYDDLVLVSTDLTIPHPRIPERQFVLIPLAEIAPDYVHPALGKTMTELKAEVDSSSIKLYQPASS